MWELSRQCMRKGFEDEVEDIFLSHGDDKDFPEEVDKATASKIIDELVELKNSI